MRHVSKATSGLGKTKREMVAELAFVALEQTYYDSLCMLIFAGVLECGYRRGIVKQTCMARLHESVAQLMQQRNGPRSLRVITARTDRLADAS